MLAAILIAAYSAVVPAFEAPDEPGHFHYVQRLAAGHGLPVQGAGGVYDPELSQPPLYYGLQALIAKAVPPTGAETPTRDRQNVFQDTTAMGNANLYSHPAAEQFPWGGQILQLHTMRLMNLLIAAVTVLATFGLAVELGAPRWLAVTAAATLAFLPQFDFIASALNADNLITATASLSMYALARWLWREPSTWLATGIGLATGAAMLSKLSGLAVLPLALVLMLWRAWRERSPRLVGHAALAGGLALAFGGWWYARNLALFGDVLGWEPMLHAIGAMQRPQPLNALQAAAVLLQQRATALAVFGWNNLHLPGWVYLTGDAVALLALAGLAGWVWSGQKVQPACHFDERSDEESCPQAPPINKRGRFFPFAALRVRMTEVWILPLWIAVFGASLVRWVAVNTDAAQWRLLLPVFPAIALLIVLGLYQVMRAWVVMLPASLAGLSIASLLFVLRPAYTPDPAYNGPIQHRLNVRFGNALELVGYDDPAPHSSPPGQRVTIALYWRAVEPVPEDDIVDLAAVDATGRAGLKESTWPQEGRAPTSGWRPGEVVRDVHALQDSTLAPGAWNVQLDVYRPVEGAPRLPIDTSGDTTVDIGRFLVNPPRIAVSSAQPEAVFEGNLTLLSHRQLQSGGNLQVSLRWQSNGSIDRDYTVFAHLLDSDGRLLAQDDSQPGAGRFPTSLLGAGVAIDDLHVLDTAGVPAGEYQIEVGLYDAQTGQRLRLPNSPADAFTWDVRLN